MMSSAENHWQSKLLLCRSMTTDRTPAIVLFSSRAPIGRIAIAGDEITNQRFKSLVPRPENRTALVYRFLARNKKYYNRKLRKSHELDIPSGNAYRKINETSNIDDFHKVGLSYDCFCGSQIRQCRYVDEATSITQYRKWYLRKKQAASARHGCPKRDGCPADFYRSGPCVCDSSGSGISSRSMPRSSIITIRSETKTGISSKRMSSRILQLTPS